MSSFRYYEIEEDTTGGGGFVLKENGVTISQNQKLVFNKQTDRMKRHERYRIRFAIKNFETARFRFVPNLDDVFWVQAGSTNSSCPTSPSELPDVIYVDKNDCAPDGRYIEVINKDKERLDFWFTLNFVDKSIPNPTQSDYEPLDPGGSNQNHGEPFYAFILACGLTGAIVGMGTDILVSGNEFVASTGALYAIGGAIVGLVVGLVADRM